MAPCILGIGFALWATMLQWLLFFDQSYLDTVVLLVSRWLFMHPSLPRPFVRRVPMHYMLGQHVMQCWGLPEDSTDAWRGFV